MTPAARLAAAASVLDSIAQGRASAEVVIKAWGAANRYAGSGDRRAVAERVYQVLRARGRLVAAMGGREDGRALVVGALAFLDRLSLEEIEALHSGEGYGPRPLSKQERARIAAGEGDRSLTAADLPAFVLEDLKATFGDRWSEEAAGLMARAPVDLRVNTAKTTVEAAQAELKATGLTPEPTPWSAVGLRLPSEPAPNIQALEAFNAGRVEIQDEGSQLTAWVAGAGLSFTPDSIVIDYCAGGGGKTLALAVQGLPAADPTRVAAPSTAGWSPTGADELAAAKSAPAAAPMRLIACDTTRRSLVPERELRGEHLPDHSGLIRVRFHSGDVLKFRLRPGARFIAGSDQDRGGEGHRVGDRPATALRVLTGGGPGSGRLRQQWGHQSGLGQLHHCGGPQ